MFFIQLPFIAEWFWSRNDFLYYARGISKTLNSEAQKQFPKEKYIEAWSKPNAFRSMLNWYRAGLRNITHVDKTPITVPTLLIWGKRDPFLKFEMAAPSIHLCNNGTLEYIEGAGHFVQHDSPEIVMNMIKNYIQ